MRENDFEEFAKLLDDAYDLIGSGANKAIGAGAKVLFFAAMAAYPLPTVRAALSAHCLDRVRGRFTPKPADLIEQIEISAASDNRPGAEEAWAIALTSQDENDTVVWTAETAEAFALSRPVLVMGDEVGARMAFKEAYTRIVTAARAARRPVQWIASPGWDIAKRPAVLARAVVAGLLPAPTAAALLPAPIGEPMPDAAARVQIAKVLKMLANTAMARTDAANAALESDWRKGESEKERIALQVAAHLASQRSSVLGARDEINALRSQA